MRIEQTHVMVHCNLGGIKSADVYPYLPEAVIKHAASFKCYPFTTKPILTQVLAQGIHYTMQKLEDELTDQVFVGFAGTGGSVVAHSLYNCYLLNQDVPPELVHFQKIGEETHRCPFHSTVDLKPEGYINLVLIDDHVSSGSSLVGMILRAMQWIYADGTTSIIWEQAMPVILDRLRIHIIVPLYFGIPDAALLVNSDTGNAFIYDMLLKQMQLFTEKAEFELDVIWQHTTPEVVMSLLQSVTIIKDPSIDKTKQAYLQSQSTY